MKPIKPQPDPGTIQPRFKPQPGYIRLNFSLPIADFDLISNYAREKSLTKHANSAALHLILREWKAWKDRQHHPVLIAIPADMLPSGYLPEEEA